MFRHDEVTVEIIEVQGDTLLVEVRTPIGRIEVMGDVERIERSLYIREHTLLGRRPVPWDEPV